MIQFEPRLKWWPNFPLSNMRLISDILSTHWHLLKEDSMVRKHIRNYPERVFKRNRSLCDRLTCSPWSLIEKKQTKGMFRCGSCTHCPWIQTSNQFSLPNGETFRPNFFADCGTQRVIYLMLSKCGAFYIGKNI